VLVCHKGQTLCIAQKDVSYHTGHGDNVGECSGSAAISEVTPAMASSKAMEDVRVANGTFGVYPNPKRGQFTVQLKGIAAKAEVLIADARGVVVERRAVQLTPGIQTLSFNLRNKAAGLYLVKVISADGVQTTKVAVQR